MDMKNIDLNFWSQYVGELSWVIGNAIDYIEEEDSGFESMEDFLKATLGIIEKIANNYDIELCDL